MQHVSVRTSRVFAHYRIRPTEDNDTVLCVRLCSAGMPLLSVSPAIRVSASRSDSQITRIQHPDPATTRVDGPAIQSLFGQQSLATLEKQASPNKAVKKGRRDANGLGLALPRRPNHC